MNCNVKKRKPIPIGYIDKPTALPPSLISGTAAMPPFDQSPGSNVVSINSRKQAGAKVRNTERSTFRIEKEEIQEAMDCLLRLKAIITLRESDSMAH